MSKYMQRLKYFIPVFGSLLLIKKVEKLERRLQSPAVDDVSFQYYEARMETIYHAIMSRLNQEEAIYFSSPVSREKVVPLRMQAEQ